MVVVVVLVVVCLLAVLFLGVIICYCRKPTKREKGPTSVTATPTDVQMTSSAAVELHTAVATGSVVDSFPPAKIMASEGKAKINFNSKESLGIGLKAEGGHVILSSVEATSAASRVPVGTKVLAVDDQSCSGKSKADVMAMIKAAKQAGAPFVVITFDTPVQIDDEDYL